MDGNARARVMYLVVEKYWGKSNLEGSERGCLLLHCVEVPQKEYSSEYGREHLPGS